jgi:hypothetical protein
MKRQFSSSELRALRKSISLPSIIAETRALTRNGRKYLGLCPFHEERTPSFAVYSDHYYCFGCGRYGDVFAWLSANRQLTFPEAVRYLGARPSSDYVPVRPRCPSSGHRSSPQSLLRIWREALDPRGSMVERYLLNRGGLRIPEGDALRFHPRCQRGSREMPGGPEFRPAMLALRTDPLSGRAVGIHRTFLLPDGSGKAPTVRQDGVSLRPKMILGSWGIIRLYPQAEIAGALGIAEGIENALTAAQILGCRPVWAAGSSTVLAHLPDLPGLEALHIFADADDAGVGLAAARQCAQTWVAAGREVAIHVPKLGTDWNDLVCRSADDR